MRNGHALNPVSCDKADLRCLADNPLKSGLSEWHIQPHALAVDWPKATEGRVGGPHLHRGGVFLRGI